MRILVLFIVLMISTSVFADQRKNKTLVREEQTIVVDGKNETWRLEWREKPIPICDPSVDPAGWYTCPCVGFEYGEFGDLVLKRFRKGKEIDKLFLNQIFSATQSSDNFDFPYEANNKSILPRYKLLQSDLNDPESPELPNKVHKRSLVKIMNLKDYDGNGKSTEFLLQIGLLPCGKRYAVLIGISDQIPTLHAFTSAETPTKPLSLQTSQWNSFLDFNKISTMTEWECDDHGSDVNQEMQLSRDTAGFHAKMMEYDCPAVGKTRSLLKETYR